MFPLCRTPARSLAGLSAHRQTTALECHVDHPANALITALRETANLTMYVTQLSVASTHPKYMSQKEDETRGGADSIRAANYPKIWAILYRWEKGIKVKRGGVVWIILLARGGRTMKRIGRTPTLVLCSRNARPEKGLVRRPHVDQHGCPSKRGKASELGRII